MPSDLLGLVQHLFQFKWKKHTNLPDLRTLFGMAALIQVLTGSPWPSVCCFWDAVTLCLFLYLVWLSHSWSWSPMAQSFICMLSLGQCPEAGGNPGLKLGTSNQGCEGSLCASVSFMVR